MRNFRTATLWPSIAAYDFHRHLYLGVAGASDFPHSRQHVFERGVINPQNGHILCDAKPGAGGVRDANRLATDAVIEASRRRKRSRNWRRTGSITIHLRSFRSFSHARIVPLRPAAEAQSSRPHLFISRLTQYDTSGFISLCKIAHNGTERYQPPQETGEVGVAGAGMAPKLDNGCAQG